MTPKDHLNPTELANKAKGYARDHPDQARSLVVRLEAALNSATRGKFSGIIDKGSSAVQKHIGLPDEQGSTTPPEPGDPIPPEPGQPTLPDPVDPTPPDPGEPGTPPLPGPMPGPMPGEPIPSESEPGRQNAPDGDGDGDGDGDEAGDGELEGPPRQDPRE